MKHTKPLNYFLGLVLFGFLAMLVSNSICGCAAVPHKEVSYFGKVGVQTPYVELDSINTIVSDCNKSTNTCEVLVTAKPVIHNPSSFGIIGSLECSYEVNTYEPPPLVVKGLNVGARKSRVVDMSNLLSIPADKSSFVTVGCLFRYRKGQTKHSSFKYRVEVKVLVKAND